MNESPAGELPNQPSGEMPPVRWLAGMAMQGLVFRHGVPDSDEARNEYALWCYRMAQSMLDVEAELHAVDDK